MGNSKNNMKKSKNESNLMKRQTIYITDRIENSIKKDPKTELLNFDDTLTVADAMKIIAAPDNKKIRILIDSAYDLKYGDDFLNRN